jgi:hypothetical protein
MPGPVFSIRRFALRVMVLLSALLAAGIIALPMAFYSSGADGIFAASVSLAVCLFGGVMALLCAGHFDKPHLVLYQVMSGMFFRMATPLGFCTLIYLNGGRLVEAGMVYYLLAFYFVTLSVEIIQLAIPPTTCASAPAKAS